MFLRGGTFVGGGGLFDYVLLFDDSNCALGVKGNQSNEGHGCGKRGLGCHFPYPQQIPFKVVFESYFLWV